MTLLKTGCWMIASAFCLMLLIPPLDGTLSKSEKKKPPPKSKKSPPGYDAETQGTVQPDSHVTYEQILQNYYRIDYKESKKFPNPVLGYVTPWNNHGYDIAKFLAQKFTHISPVWFQVRVTPDRESYMLGGTHDLDQGWIEDVRKNNSQVKIVPRFLFEGFTGEDFKTLFLMSSRQESLIELVTDFCRRNKFDGIVMEVWIQAAIVTRGLSVAELLDFIVLFAETFHQHDLEFILAVPPKLSPGRDDLGVLFQPQHFAELVNYVDYFSVMTYDYPERKVTAVAPLPWVRQCMEAFVMENPENARKLLMGVNFYGYDYHPMGAKLDPVMGKQYVEILRKNKPEIHWDTSGAEHFIEYDGHTLYYPSLWSIDARLKLARDLGFGIAIWETGQGLDYFYNLL